jgi:hypothetical protein
MAKKIVTNPRLKKKGVKFIVDFEISAHYEQVIEIYDKKITRANLQAGLRSGKISAEMRKGSIVFIHGGPSTVSNAVEVIGRVVSCSIIGEEQFNHHVDYVEKIIG